MPSRYQALLEVMRGRRSVRRFRTEVVPEELLEQVLEAARLAPSAGNRQPYRFLVVSSPPLIEQTAAAVRAATATLRTRARAGEQAELSGYLDHFEHFVGAPLLIVPIYRSGGPDLLGEGAGRDAPVPRAIADGLSSVAAAIMSLLLAAHALGLGCCWMTGPLVAEAALRALLSVPHGWSIAALLPLGYPDEEPEPRSRRPLAQLMRRLDGAAAKGELR